VFGVLKRFIRNCLVNSEAKPRNWGVDFPHRETIKAGQLVFHFLGSSLNFESALKSIFLLLFFQVEFLLVGAALLTYLGAGRLGPLNLFDQAFLGYCVVTCFAQTWSIFGGLSPFSNYFLLGWVFVLVSIKWRAFVVSVRTGLGMTRIRSALVLVPIGLAAACNAITEDYCYDNALYHLLSVRWIAEFGSVPGLANLHGRLGFNSSLVALSGLFSVPFGVSIGREFVNGATTVLVAGVLSQGLNFKNWRYSNPSRNLYAFGLLAFVVMLVLSPCLSSPQPDIASAVVAIGAAWYFFGVVKFSGDGDHFEFDRFLLCVSGATVAVELKLSYIGFAAATVLVALSVALRRRVSLRLICLGLLFALMILTPWICCGYITSGCPFFPSDFGRLNFDWVASHQSAITERDAAFAWARAPGLQPSEVLGNWNWLRPWIARVLDDPSVGKTLLAGAVGLLLLCGRLLMRPSPQFDRRWFLLLFPPMVGLLFWFLTAPDPRFAEATLWVFALNLLLLPFRGTDDWSRRLNIVGTYAVAMVVLFDAGVGGARLIKEKKRLPNIVERRIDLSVRKTNSGLSVWIPKVAYEPGDSQLIATPPDRFNSRLELRSANLRDGFRIGGEVEN
jgi:hypothetical protein